MDTNYISCTDTAKIIRKVLKEAFKSVKFSVRSDKYAGGASIDINWQDGPTTKQVDEYCKRFAGSYFDGMIDYQGSRYAEMNGEPVQFLSNYVTTNRSKGPELTQRAIDAVLLEYPEGFGQPLTVEGYQAGKYWMVNTPGADFNAGQLIHQAACKISLSEPNPSPTAESVTYTGNDGYSQQCGMGIQ